MKIIKIVLLVLLGSTISLCQPVYGDVMECIGPDGDSAFSNNTCPPGYKIKRKTTSQTDTTYQNAPAADTWKTDLDEFCRKMKQAEFLTVQELVREADVVRSILDKLKIIPPIIATPALSVLNSCNNLLGIELEIRRRKLEFEQRREAIMRGAE